MKERDFSIIREFYTEQPFVDRFTEQPELGVDVIIPVIHTNELWVTNLYSFYREIPIHSLLIGDGGCIDDSIELAKTFPRVQILDHRKYISLGYSIRKLIEEVKTDWFIYVHSDAYLPPGWFDAMYKHQIEYDWFGCIMQNVYMVEFDNDYEYRPWAGSQMGRKIAFLDGLKRIDDDYVYRQEDFIFADIVKKAGYKEGKITDTLHYHQTMIKPTPWSRKINKIQINVDISREEEVRTAMMQIKGIIKYLDPDPIFIKGILENLYTLEKFGEMQRDELLQWVEHTNPKWLLLLNSSFQNLSRQKSGFMEMLKKMSKQIFRYIKNFF